MSPRGWSSAIQGDDGSTGSRKMKLHPCATQKLVSRLQNELVHLHHLHGKWFLHHDFVVGENLASMQSRPAISALVSPFASHLISFLKSAFRSRTTLVAENLFLRKQLAFYREHKIRPQPLTDAARLSLVLWSRLFHWKRALMIVKPETRRLASERL